MQPLDTYHLVLNFLVVVMMPLIIWANLKGRASQSMLHDYLWGEHPNLMRVSIAILALLTVYSASDLLIYYGILPAGAADFVTFGFGIPFLILSIALIWIAVRAVLKVLRDRRDGASKT